MNKKIIAISSSPSHGFNSDSMLDYFIKGVRKVEGVEIDKYYLTDIPIDFYSFENSKGPKENEVEFKEITDKMMEANALVIATPTYNFSVPGHLKIFIDRLRFFALDFSRKTRLNQPVGMLTNLNTYFLVSGGTPNWAKNILFFAFPAFWLRGVFVYYGANCLGSFYSGDVKTCKNEKILNKCEKKGYSFAKKIAKGRNKSATKTVFWRPPQVHHEK